MHKLQRRVPASGQAQGWTGFIASGFVALLQCLFTKRR